MKFSEVEQYLTNKSNYFITVGLEALEAWVKENKEEYGLKLNPDFQRGHVWTQEQQIAFLEYFFKGGKSGRDLYFNCPSWSTSSKTDYDKFVCVDGLQRITAILKFINNELPIFNGNYFKDFEDKPRRVLHYFTIHVNDLQNKKDVLKWYVQMNDGGTPHTKEEIEKVNKMIGEC